MRYYVTYDGAIHFTEKPSEEALEELDYMFENFNYDEHALAADFGGDETSYYGDGIPDSLNALKDITESGEIQWTGEDGCHWRHIFRDGKWVGENARVVFETEPALNLSPKEESEFIGQFIDIIEDYVYPDGKPSGQPIGGADYDRLAAQIRSLLHNWHVL